MRGTHCEQSGMFSYISAERRVPKDHPLRAIRAMVDTALKDLHPRLDGLYARGGRPSIAPERLLRALLLQMLYSVRSERMLMEQLDYNLLFRWFVGLVRLAQDRGVVAEDTTSRCRAGRLDVHLCSGPPTTWCECAICWHPQPKWGREPSQRCTKQQCSIPKNTDSRFMETEKLTFMRNFSAPC
jgi:Transposase domain (DUF772)